MQVLLAWKSQGLDAAEALTHWRQITGTWTRTYQALTNHALTFAAAHCDPFYLGLLTVPHMFLEWNAYSDDASTAVAWAGIAHNLPEAVQPQPGESPNQAFLSRLQQAGDRLLQQLDGRFVVGILQRPEHALRVIVNAYGLTPCFWTTGPYGLAAGTRIAPLLDLVGKSRIPNPTALLKMVAINWCFGTETPFEAVYQAQPGSEIILEDDRDSPTIRTYTSPDYILAKSQDFGKDYLHIGSEAFITTITRQLRHTKNPIMNVTGGMDSRTIAATVVSLGHHPECDVSGELHLKEVKIASTVARTLNLHLHHFSPGEHYAEHLERALQLWSLWTEGMSSAYHEFARSTVALTPKMFKFYTKYFQVFHGVGGGMGKNFYYATDMLFHKPSPQDVIARLKKYQFENIWLTDNENALIQAELPNTIFEGVRLGLEGHQLFDYFYWRERAGHWGGYLVDMQQFGRHVFAPICDPTLTSAFFCMSVEERLRRAWHEYHLKRLFPVLTTIPYIKPPVLKGVRELIYHMHPTLYKLCYLITPNVPFKRPNAGKTLAYRNREKQGVYFHSYLHQLLFSGDIWWPTLFPYEKGQKMWEYFISGKDVQPLWNLVSIELWAKNFLA